MVLGEDLLPPAAVHVDVSEDLLASHITREKKTLYWVPVGVQDRTVWALIDTGEAATPSHNEITRLFPSYLRCALLER